MLDSRGGGAGVGDRFGDNLSISWLVYEIDLIVRLFLFVGKTYLE